MCREACRYDVTFSTMRVFFIGFFLLQWLSGCGCQLSVDEKIVPVPVDTKPGKVLLYLDSPDYKLKNTSDYISLDGTKGIFFLRQSLETFPGDRITLVLVSSLSVETVITFLIYRDDVITEPPIPTVPSITQDVSLQAPDVIVNGTPATFICTATGFETKPVFNWSPGPKRNGRVIVDEINEEETWTSVIKFQPIYKRDGEQVNCTVRGDNIEIWKTVIFTVHQEMAKENISVVVYVKPAIVQYGGEITLHCNQTAGGPIRMRLYNIAANRTLIGESSGAVSWLSANLTVTESSTFECEGFDESDSVKSLTRVYVKDTTTTLPPTAMPSPQAELLITYPTYIEEGRDANFTCEVRGIDEEPRFTWAPPGDSERIQVTPTSKESFWTSTLQFKPILKTDEGSVTCEATGSVGEQPIRMIKSIGVKVNTQVQVRITPESVAIQSGDQFTLTCRSEPARTVRMIWYTVRDVDLFLEDSKVPVSEFSYTGSVRGNTTFVCEAVDGGRRMRSNEATVFVIYQVVSSTTSSTTTTSTTIPTTRTTESVNTTTTSETVPTNTTSETVPTTTTSEIVPTNTTSEIVPTNTTSEIVPTNTTSEIVPTNTTSEIVPTNTTSEIVPTNTTSETVPTNTTSEIVPTNTTSETVPTMTTSEMVQINTTSEKVPTTQQITTTSESIPTNTTSEIVSTNTTSDIVPTNTTSESVPTTTPSEIGPTTTTAATTTDTSTTSEIEKTTSPVDDLTTTSGKPDSSEDPTKTVTMLNTTTAEKTTYIPPTETSTETNTPVVMTSTFPTSTDTTTSTHRAITTTSTSKSTSSSSTTESTTEGATFATTVNLTPNPEDTSSTSSSTKDTSTEQASNATITTTTTSTSSSSTATTHSKSEATISSSTSTTTTETITNNTISLTESTTSTDSKTTTVLAESSSTSTKSSTSENVTPSEGSPDTSISTTDVTTTTSQDSTTTSTSVSTTISPTTSTSDDATTTEPPTATTEDATTTTSGSTSETTTVPQVDSTSSPTTASTQTDIGSTSTPGTSSFSSSSSSSSSNTPAVPQDTTTAASSETTATSDVTTGSGPTSVSTVVENNTTTVTSPNPDTTSIGIMSCPEITDDNGEVWNKAEAGVSIVHPCPSGLQGKSTRICENNGEWGVVRFDDVCRSNSLNATAKKITQIQEGTFEGSFAEVFQELDSAVDPESMSPSNMDKILNMVDTMTEQLQKTEVKGEDIKKLMNLAENMLKVDKENWGTKGPKNLLTNIDAIAKSAITGENKFEQTFFTETIFFEIGSAKEKNIECPDLGGDIPDWVRDMNTSTRVMKESYPDMSGDERVWYSGVIYRTVEALLEKQYLTEIRIGAPSEIRSDMVDSSKALNKAAVKDIVSGVMSFNSVPNMENLNPPLYVTFQIERQNDVPICSFIDYNETTGFVGNWSAEGCRVVSRDGSKVVCACNHTTNFAILMNPFTTEETEHDYILGMISIVGCGISLLFLLTTVIVYCMVWRHMVKTHVARVKAILLMNLCVTLIISYTLFLAGVGLTQDRYVCTAVAALLHYFFLAVFCVMLAEGIHLFISIVIVINFTSYLKSLFILIWVTPALIVGITIGIVKIDGYTGQRFCWLSTESNVIWAFVAPALIIILVNTIILLVSLRRMMVRRDDKVLKQGKYLARALGVILPIIGITWLFGVFAVNGDLIAFQYLFAICNSLQGTFIFIFHCCTSNVRAAFRDMRNRFHRQSISKSTLKSGSVYRTKSSQESYHSVDSNNSNYHLSLKSRARNSSGPFEQQGNEIGRFIALPGLFDKDLDTPNQILLKGDTLREYRSPTSLQEFNLGFTDPIRRRVAFSGEYPGDHPFSECKETRIDPETERRRSISFIPMNEAPETELEGHLRQRRRELQLNEVSNVFSEIRRKQEQNKVQERWQEAYNAIGQARKFQISPQSSSTQETSSTTVDDSDRYIMMRL